MKPPTHLAVREWHRIDADRHGLTLDAVTRLLAAADRAATGLGLPRGAVLERTGTGLKAGQVVGVLAVPGVTVEILPKVGGTDGAVRTALIRMLAVAKGLKVAYGDLAALDTQRHYLLERLIRLFAERLLTAVRRGLPRRYVPHEEDLPILRGALNVKRQFAALAVRPDLVASRFDELSEDTPLNRVCKAAVTRLVGVTRLHANHRRLMELLARLDNVSDSVSPLDEPVALDRTNAAFHEVHSLARLFLQGHWQDATSGRRLGFALLFPMNDLFEEFVGRSLQTALSGARVQLQSHRTTAKPTAHPDDTATSPATEASHPAGSTYWVRPDIVVWPDKTPGKSPHKAAAAAPDHPDPDRPVVIDTKWKRIGRGSPSSADVHQMLVYGQAYRARRVVLVYPWHKAAGKREGVHRRWLVTGADYELETATIDIGQPDKVKQSLRALLKASPASA